MPLYTFRNKTTGETKDMLLTISEMQKMTEEGEWEQVIGSPKLVTHVGSMIGKTPDSWKSHLKAIKKSAGKRHKNSVNT